MPVSSVPSDSELLSLFWAKSPRILGIVEVDFAERDIAYLTVNDALARDCGLAADAVRGKWFRRDLDLHSTLVDSWIGNYSRAAAAPVDSHVFHAAGRRVHVVRLGENSGTGRPLFSVEATPEQSAEAAAHEKSWRDLAAVVPIVVYKGDSGGSMTFVNEHWRKLVGADPATALGRGWLVFVDPADRAEVETKWRAAVDAKEDFSHEFRFRKESGEEVFVCGHVQWIVNAGTVYAAGTFANVTPIKKAELALADKNKQLDKALKEAEVAKRAKQNFLTNMAHELRTPLHGITATITLLKATEITPEQRELLQTLRNCADQLIRIINEIIDFTQIESGAVVLENKPFALQTSVENVFRLLRPEAAEKGIKLLASFNAKLPVVIVGDIKRMEQILLNIVGNAIKFTEEGGQVDVDVRLSEPVGHELGVLFTVTDTGVGISDESRKNLFEPFAKGKEASSRAFGGNGLGLVISRSLARMMKGDVWFDPTFSDGSRFHISIKTKPSELVPPADPVFEKPRVVLTEDFAKSYPLVILIAEDNLINQKLAVKILKKLGYAADLASNGQEAVDAIASKDFDLILMDIQMPVMGGLEATQRIRASVPREKQPFIVALTASAIEGDREHHLAEKLDDYIAKPLDIVRLKETLKMCSEAKRKKLS